MLLRLAAVLAQFPSVPDPGEGNDSLHVFLNSFYVLLALGFLIALVGHITKLRGLIVTGIVMIFAGTGMFLLAIANSG